MVSDVLTALARTPGLDAVAVVTADERAAAAARQSGAEVVLDTERAGQSAAARLGIRHAQDHGFQRVLLVPGDIPLLAPAELVALMARADAEQLGVVVVPDRHGEGTNALLLRPPDAIAPSFGPGSRERHVESARASGKAHAVEALPSLVLDIDTGDDLDALVRALESGPGQAAHTRRALRRAALPV